MKVNGYEVPAEVEEACIGRMKVGEFRASHIECSAWGALPPMPTTPTNIALIQRIADRLIQRERMAKRIKKAEKYPYWVWCGKG